MLATRASTSSLTILSLKALRSSKCSFARSSQASAPSRDGMEVLTQTMADKKQPTQRPSKILEYCEYTVRSKPAFLAYIARLWSFTGYQVFFFIAPLSRHLVHLQHFVAVVVDHLDGDLPRLRHVERERARRVQSRPRRLVHLGAEGPLEALVGLVGDAEFHCARL